MNSEKKIFSKPNQELGEKHFHYISVGRSIIAFSFKWFYDVKYMPIYEGLENHKEVQILPNTVHIKTDTLITKLYIVLIEGQVKPK